MVPERFGKPAASATSDLEDTKNFRKTSTLNSRTSNHKKSQLQMNFSSLPLLFQKRSYSNGESQARPEAGFQANCFIQSLDRLVYENSFRRAGDIAILIDSVRN